MWKPALAGLAAIGCLAGGPPDADDVWPVQIQIREQEPSVFLVEWQVPRAVPRPAVPVPRLPEDCRAEAGAETSADETSWRSCQRYRCPQGIGGRAVGVVFPFGNPSMSTVLRIELLSGERHAHMLAPGVDEWTVPGSTPNAPLHMLRRAVADETPTPLAGGCTRAGRWAGR